MNDCMYEDGGRRKSEEQADEGGWKQETEGVVQQISSNVECVSVAKFYWLEIVLIRQYFGTVVVINSLSMTVD